MEIANPHYALAKRVEKYSEIKNIAKEMVRFAENFKPIKGYYEKVFCLSHTEVSTTPFAFFVVVKELTDAKMFPSQVIINPEIIETPEEVEIQGLIEKGGKPFWGLTKRDNHIKLVEGCIQFPFREPKKVDRYFKLKVRFFYKTILGLRKVEKWVEGDVAHVFQHNCDHIAGKNIYFDTGEKIKWWELIGKGYKSNEEINLGTDYRGANIPEQNVWGKGLCKEVKDKNQSNE